MANAAHAVQSCTSNLAAYLTASIPSLTVLTEWPGANQRLAYPSLTIFTGKITTMNRAPEQISVTAPNGSNQVTAIEVIGEHDFTIQLDLWTRTRFERDQMLGQVFGAINAAAADSSGNNNPAGLSLQLTDYFNDYARFDIAGHQLIDDEAAAQRQERRVKIDLLVNCRAIQSRTYYAMATIQTFTDASIKAPMTDDAANTEQGTVD